MQKSAGLFAKLALLFMGVSAYIYTNQYKGFIAQREFSGPEARQRVKSIVILRLSSLTQHQYR
ncbi:hypothetical protein TUM4438_17530 [Shewanella sairae]|uniref:Uncharacterized protein n=1 Tax=Shewanella sairae TaxID=190310 RepID=A0ABQ4PBU7_9GAMM|nr:hypothetical protein TUM4438_17530 [Shewanella sairae]